MPVAIPVPAVHCIFGDSRRDVEVRVDCPYNGDDAMRFRRTHVRDRSAAGGTALDPAELGPDAYLTMDYGRRTLTFWDDDTGCEVLVAAMPDPLPLARALRRTVTPDTLRERAIADL
jgi:hypothetical protein